jgi:Rne/Rng family ribonuclease
MSKEMVISANPHETRVAILEEGQLCEYYVEREKEFALVGSIYKGRVTRVLPGMQSSFVDIGLDSDAFLYVSDFLEIEEELDDHPAPPAEGPGAPTPAAAASTTDSVAAVVDESGGNFNTAAPADLLMSSASASASPVPALNTAQQDRPHFENRGRGRDFGRRGGRRGGRFNRRGGRGGDRRYGRELPPSKYASSRTSHEHDPEPVPPPEGYLPIILPGESLAKYKDKPQTVVTPTVEESISAPAAAAPVDATPVEAAESGRAKMSEPEVGHVERPEHVEHKIGHIEAKRPDHVRSHSSGLEPLPGETLSKWKAREPVAEISVEPPIATEPVNDADVEHEHEEEAVASEELIEALAEEGLTADEAAAVAEHVAEAQSDQAARAAEERAFAAEEHAIDEAAEQEEELEEEEEAAETEGMIAPPPDSEEDRLAALSAEDEAEAEDEIEADVQGEEVLESLIETEHLLEAQAGVAPTEDTLPIPAETPLAQEQRPWKATVRDDYRARMHNPARRGRDRGRRDDRGRRPHHGYRGHGHRPQQRRPQLIADLLKQGQEIIVQIAKEPLGKKGARITSHVALPGRYLVYMPTLDHTGVSRKIASAEERSRLRHLVNDAKGSAGGGFIVRTAAASAAPEEVRADVEFLTRTWSDIKAKSEQRKAPSLLHRDLNLVERMLRDHINNDYAAIWVDSEEEYTKVVDFMGRFQPGLANRVKLYTKDTPVFEEFGIQQEIDKGLRPKVWLKSGGYIVINHTEALVAIDVNTGKFVGKGSNRLEDTIVRTNLEAVKEIVRQMRLRDLGGIIVIDFIDMEERRNRDKVMAALEDALRADRAPSKVLRFNEFGLVAITRKRTKQALERTLCQPCPYCTGSGMVKSIPTLCYEIQTEARKMAPEMDSGSVTLRVHPEIAKALKTRESALIEELERWTKKSIIIQADPTLHWEQYDIY